MRVLDPLEQELGIKPVLFSVRDLSTYTFYFLH